MVIVKPLTLVLMHNIRVDCFTVGYKDNSILDPAIINSF